MPKNIIVCADGTGNKGGYTPDSNVYKVYKSVNKSFKGETQDCFKVDKQIVFYDNGVGTEKNKYLRMLFGAFGFGFEDNVCDLYKFLAQNFELGDRIYFFGFSRGASTVRACNGLIKICGLAKGKGLQHRKLEKLVNEAFHAYKVYERKPEEAEALKKSERSHGVIDIQFLGVWDTVVALGFPKRTAITDPVSAILNALFLLAEKGLNMLWPHSFYFYRLTENVKYAYQALAIDDERTAFWPFVWQEKGREANTVEQVWFAGMHSNVGGGYARSGMAGVPLHWMMLRAEQRGLCFYDDAVQKAFENSHIHGRMYNSRDGFAVFYRYHPREIEKLCDDRLAGNIRIHRSVIERINNRTANYTPGQLPGKFMVVENDPEISPESRNPGKDPKWALIRKEIDGWVLWRKRLYSAMLTFTLAIVFIVSRFWDYSPQPDAREGIPGLLASILDFFLPDFLDGLIDAAVVEHFYPFIGVAIVFYAYLRVRRKFHIKTTEACERLRHLIIHEKGI